MQVRARNAKSVFENEELDLVMSNGHAVNGLPPLGPYFSVECKNWSKPVGSAEICWFATKLRRSGQRFGVLVAANGVTGNHADLTAAHFEAATALREGQAVVLLTLPELTWLQAGEALADLLCEKHARLVAHRELHIQKGPPPPYPLPRGPERATIDSERQDVLAEMAHAVEQSPDRVRSLDVALSHFRTALSVFVESENREFEVDGDEGWIEENMLAFERLEESVQRIGEASIAELRARGGADWTIEYLILGVEVRAPQNLEAPPDSELAELVLGHWMRAVSAGPSHQQTAALLCMLGWAAEWRSAMETGRWPPSMV